MNDMKCLIKCPICGEVLQKYGEIDPDAGTSIVLGANCPKCGIGNSDIKLWQELIRTRKALDVAKSVLENISSFYKSLILANPVSDINWDVVAENFAKHSDEALDQIKHITESPAENVQSDAESRPVNVQEKMTPEEFAELELLANATFK